MTLEDEGTMFLRNVQNRNPATERMSRKN